MNEIVQCGNSVLRQKAQEVPLADIGGQNIQAVLKKMKTVLDACPDGAALAAPQIGESWRIFILSERVFRQTGSHASFSDNTQHFVFINPVITKRSSKHAVMDEGCLSVKGKYGNIVRSTNVTITAYDEYGKKFTRGAGGLLAQAFQHECDHLEGILFIDTAKKVWDVAPEGKGMQ